MTITKRTVTYLVALLGITNATVAQEQPMDDARLEHETVRPDFHP